MPGTNNLRLVGALSAAATSLLTFMAGPATAAEPPNPAFDTGVTPPAPTQYEGSRPERPSGETSRMSEAELAAAALSDCDALRYCAWTGGYFTGPSINFVSGYAYNWGNYRQDACAFSGTSGAIWKNCASSLSNRSTTYRARYYALPNGTGFFHTQRPGKTDDQLGVFNNNVDSSTSSLV